MNRCLRALLICGLLYAASVVPLDSQQTNPPRTVVQADPLYKAMDSALGFFNRLRQVIDREVVDPVMREDVLKSLRSVSNQMVSVIQECDDLESAINRSDNQAKQDIIDKLRTALSDLRVQIRTLEINAPDANRVPVGSATNDLDLLLNSHLDLLAELAHDEPSIAKTKAEEVRKRGVQISTIVNSLIAQLAAENAKGVAHISSFTIPQSPI